MLFLSLFLLCFCARLSIDALWSPAGKGLSINFRDMGIQGFLNFGDIAIFTLGIWNTFQNI